MHKSQVFNAISTGFLVVASLLLSGCGSKLVKCYGVAKKGKSAGLVTAEGVCKKLADSNVVALTPNQAKQAKRYPYSSYVKCYGVAAGGKNDCGTKTTACAGTVSVSREADAWIAIPKGVCQKVKGGVVVEPKK